MATYPLPPLDGTLTVIPGLLDFHVQHNPDRPFALFPTRDHPSQASKVTFAELAKATHRVAHLARPNRLGREGEVIGLLINCDVLLYITVIQGLIRAGLVVRVTLRSSWRDPNEH